MRTTARSDFGTLLRELRVAAKLTQEELAARAGMSVRGISDLERGIYRGPRPYTLRRLEAALQLSEYQRALLQSAMDARTAGSEPAPGLKSGNFLGAEPSGRLIARAEHVSHIRRGLDAMLHGSGRTLLLSGSPGVGKTRLAQETARLAATCGVLVVSGRCHDGEEGSAFYPFLEALEGMLCRLPESIRSVIPSRWPYVTALLPQGSVPELNSFTADNQQQRIFRAVTGLVQETARTRPLALLIDDLHWADTSSLLLLQHLARFTRGDRVFLLGTFRDVDFGDHPPLERMHSMLVREGMAESISVEPFVEEETAALVKALLGDEPSSALVDLVQAKTAGNAFFIREVVRTLKERDDLVLDEGRWTIPDDLHLGLPDTIRGAVRDRMAQLTERDQAVLREASVLGERFAVGDLVAMSGDRDATERALDRAWRLGLVHERGELRYAFAHALTREAMYAELPPETRRRLHRAAARALAQEANGSRVAETAWHWRQGGETQKALSVSLEAGGRAAGMGAAAEAVGHYRVARDLARALHDEESERVAVLGLGSSLVVAGPPEEALDTLMHSADLFRAAGDLQREGKALAHLCELHRIVGTDPVSLDRPVAVLDALESEPPSSAHPLLGVGLARLTFVVGRYEESRQYAERAAAIAAAVGEHGLQALAETRAGTALFLLGRHEEARAVLEGAIRRAEAAGDHLALSEGLRSATSLYQVVGDIESAWSSANRAIAVEERFGATAGLAWVVMLRGEIAQLAGDWEAARRDLDRAVVLYRDLARPSYASVFAAYTALTSGELSILIGDRDSGLSAVEEALTILRRHGHRIGIQQAEIILADLALFEGRAAEAVARLEAAAAEAPDTFPAQLTPILAEAYLRNDAAARARHVLQEAAERHDEISQAPLRIPLRRVRALLALHDGDWDLARTELEEAVSEANRPVIPYHRARALLEFGVFERSLGNTNAARDRFHQALAIFRRLGAQPYVERTEAALESLK